jgi:hypothetical protein
MMFYTNVVVVVCSSDMYATFSGLHSITSQKTELSTQSYILLKVKSVEVASP